MPLITMIFYYLFPINTPYATAGIANAFSNQKLIKATKFKYSHKKSSEGIRRGVSLLFRKQSKKKKNTSVKLLRELRLFSFLFP